MPSTPQSLMTYLQSISGAWRNDPRDDTELLARFTETRDESAFAALVLRHGALVWRVCRRLLGDGPDTEDAFQAVFMALARKAPQFTIKNPAGWLHRVARQVSLDIQTGVRRRQNLKQEMRSMPRLEVKEDAGKNELYATLDEELASLPERLRIPLILRYLEGKSLEEAARIVGCSRRALGKRLERGEATLRERMERRGLETGAIATLLTGSAAAPTVPVRLVENTARAAVAFRSGTLVGGAADAAEKLLRAVAMESVVRTDWWMVIVSICCLGVGGAGLVAWKMYGDGSGVVTPVAPESAVPSEAVPLVTISSRRESVDCFGDPLPEGALARIGTLRFRRPGNGSEFGPGVAFLPDGKTLVSVDGHSAYFWEWATGKELRRLDGIYGFNIAISPEGKMLASNGEYWDLTVDPPRRLQRKKVPTLASYGGVAFSPDGKTVAWAGSEKRKDGGGDRKLVYLIDPTTGNVKKTLEDAGDRCLAFSLDGKTLATGAGATALWDVTTGTKLCQGDNNGAMVLFLAFLPDGRTLLESRPWLNLGKVEMQMRYLDAATCEEKRLAGAAYPEYQFSNRRGGRCLSPDGRLLALNSNGVVSVWDMVTGREVGPAGGIHFPVAGLAFSSNGRKLATLACDKQLQLWEADTGHLEKVLSLPYSAWLGSFRYLDANRLELIHGHHPWGIMRCDAETGKTEEIKERLSTDLASLMQSSLCCDTSSDGQYEAWGLAKCIVLVDRSKGKEVGRLPLSENPYFVAFAANGQSVLILSNREEGARLDVWSTVTGKRRISVWSPTFVWSKALSPDGRWLAFAQGELVCEKSGSHIKGSVQLLEVASGTETTLKTDADVCAVAWSSDSRWLACGSEKGNVWIWDMAIGREVRRFVGHQRNVTALAFSPDGLRLASGSKDTTALIWDLCGLSRSEAWKKDLLTPDVLWASLQGNDPADASRSIHLLVHNPDVALPLLRKRLRPTPVPDPSRVAMLLTQLDNDNFKVRQETEVQLEKMGEGIEPFLQETLSKESSPEVRHRIINVLNKVFGPLGPGGLNSRQLQAYRGVEVLERIGTPAAREVLEELSQLPSGMVQAEEAKSALKRLTKLTPVSVP